MSYPIRVYSPLDNACLLDSESLDYGGDRLMHDLQDDMRDHSITHLALHYPQFTFGFQPGAGKPKGHVLTQSVRGGWRWADWRVA